MPPAHQHITREVTQTAVAIRKTARIQGLDCNRGRNATQLTSPPTATAGRAAISLLAVSLPRASLFSSHPAVASPTPPVSVSVERERVASEVRSSHKPEPRTAQQQGRPRKRGGVGGPPSREPEPPRLPCAEQKPASGSGVPFAPLPAPAAERRSAPGPGRRLVSGSLPSLVRKPLLGRVVSLLCPAESDPSG